MTRKVFLLLFAIVLFSVAATVVHAENCGKQGGNQRCAGSACCSQYGWCGTSDQHCGAGCQSGFGQCSSGGSSNGGSGAENPAPIVRTCTQSGTFALTFDDGISANTHKVLDILKKHGVKATFFVNGNNYECIYDQTAILKRMKEEGHQIGMHSWSHPDMATISQGEIRYQITKLEKAVKDILGVVPKYFRLPYGSGENVPAVLNTLGNYGYTLVSWAYDSEDALSPERSCKTLVNGYKKLLNEDGYPKPYISLSHDPSRNTANCALDQVISLLKSKKYKLVTVAQCLGESDSSKWYKSHGKPGKRDSSWKCTPADRHL